MLKRNIGKYKINCQYLLNGNIYFKLKKIEAFNFQQDLMKLLDMLE